MHERLKLILGHIRTFAIKGIRAHQEAHQAALSQASRAEHERIVRFLKVNNGRSSRSLGSGRGSKSVFTDISSVLSFIEYEYGGFPPSQHEAIAFMRLVYNRFSLKELQYRLFLTTETAVYYLIIILIDTAMNISSALELDVGSLYETEGSNNYKLTWYKKRKGEDPIEDYFEGSKTQTDDEIGVVEVIKFLKQLNARLRDFAIPSERDKLFLVGNLKGPNGSSGKYRVGILTEHLEGKAWHRLRQRDPLLSRFPITLDMIRSSVLLLECLETNYDLFAVNKKAHHSSVGTTIRYNQRAAVRTLNNSQVREVQDFIVASATASQPQIRSELGLTPERATEILSKAKHKGFGSWSSLRKRSVSGEGSEDVTRERMSAFERWMVSGEKILIADVNVAAEIIVFRSHIMKERSFLEQTPAWLETWAPMLLFLNSALEEMGADLRVRGEKLSSEMEIFYGGLD